MILHGVTGHRDDFLGILPALGERLDADVENTAQLLEVDLPTGASCREALQALGR